MKVKRIVANIKTENIEATKFFYKDLLGLDILMDNDWVITYGSIENKMPIEISVATEGGSGTEVPDISIEVDDLDEVLIKVKDANFFIEYGPETEPWGVRRFYVRDPDGKLVNILTHV